MCNQCFEPTFTRVLHGLPTQERTLEDLLFHQLLYRSKVKAKYNPLIWIPETQQYQIPKGLPNAGKFLSHKAVRDVADNEIVKSAKMMNSQSTDVVMAAQALQKRKITQSEYAARVHAWKEEMKRELKVVNLNNLAAAAGGHAHVDSKDYNRAGAILRFHYKKLRKFADEIIANPDIVLDQAPGKMKFRDRVMLYAESGRFTHENQREVGHKRQGYTQYKNVPHSKESCVNNYDAKNPTQGCYNITLLGYTLIGSQARIGKRTCGVADKCTWAFK